MAKAQKPNLPTPPKVGTKQTAGAGGGMGRLQIGKMTAAKGKK